MFEEELLDPELFDVWSQVSPPPPAWADSAPDGDFDQAVFDSLVFDTGAIWTARNSPTPSWGDGATESPSWTPHTPPPPSWATE